MRWKRVVILLALLFTLLFFLIVGAMYVFAKVPEPSEIARAQSVLVFDRNGKGIGRISAGADRVSVKFKDMPKDLRDAVIATEDRQFYHHHGVRVTSIFRAALSNAFSKNAEQGGSTITQQYVKNAFLGPQRTMVRKVKEALLAIKFERKHMKDEILEDYLNTIYLGRGAYGCEAAASTYFGAHCRTLTLAQSATLAGIIHAPESYDPTRNPEETKARRDAVLGFMVRDHYITQEEADRAKGTRIRVSARLGVGIAPHFLEEVRRELEAEIGPGALYAGGVRVHSTLDMSMQEAANDAVSQVYDRASDPEAALIALDPKDGAVRAWIGSRSFSKREADLALSRRRPGSTFKPVVLATAVREGMSTKDVYSGPSKINIAGTTFSNYAGESFGSLSVEEATWHSVNTVYVQLMKKVGVGDAIETARDLGIRSKLNEDIGLALGDSNVSPLELATMYATLASRGARHKPFFVSKVTNASKKVVFEAKDEASGTIEHKVADRVTSVLQGVIRNGTGRAASIGRPAAGKTGTTDHNTDAWFAGYTPQLVGVVWNGYAASERSMSNVHGISVTGGSYPARMWQLFMSRAHAGLPVRQFATPAAEPAPSISTSSSPSKTPSPTPTSTIPSPVATVPNPVETKKKGKSSPSPTPSPTPSPSPS